MISRKTTVFEYAGNVFEIEVMREMYSDDADDYAEMASIMIERPFGEVWSGGEYALDMNEWEDEDGYDHRLPGRVYDKLVEFVETKCRYQEWN